MYFLCCSMYFCVVLFIFVLFYVFLCCSMYFCVVLFIFVSFYVFFCVVLCIFVLFCLFLYCSMYFCVVMCIFCVVLRIFLCCSMYFCVVLCIVCFVSYSVLFVCKCVTAVLLSPGGYPTAVNKYIIYLDQRQWNTRLCIRLQQRAWNVTKPSTNGQSTFMEDSIHRLALYLRQLAASFNTLPHAKFLQNWSLYFNLFGTSRRCTNWKFHCVTSFYFESGSTNV